MSIISSYCETEQAVLDQFNQATKGSTLYELRRLAQEAHAAFGLQIGKVWGAQTMKPSVRLVTPDGILCGHGSVVKESVNSAGEAVYRYWLTMPTISKEKSSANSDRNSRDSSNLAALIRTVKKNNETPTTEKLLRAMNDGMKYTMRVVASLGRNQPRVSFDHDLTLAVTRFILGVDSSLPNMYINDLKDKFDQFQSQMQSFEAANADYARYTRGVTLVCINTTEDKPHYLVGDATFDTANDRFDFQGSLKRYNSLADSPIAPTVTMIRTFMQGCPDYDNSNELGLRRQDKYFQDIDIAVGYSRPQEVWVAIPKFAQ